MFGTAHCVHITVDVRISAVHVCKVGLHCIIIIAMCSKNYMVWCFQPNTSNLLNYFHDVGSNSSIIIVYVSVCVFVCLCVYVPQEEEEHSSEAPSSSVVVAWLVYAVEGAELINNNNKKKNYSD